MSDGSQAAVSRARRLALLLLVSACSASPAGAPRAMPAPAVEAPASVSPARWAFFDRLGTLFDQAGHAGAMPRPEPAIVDGVRVVVEAGVIVGSARHADRFGGFRSLPERLGGGFVLWSEGRVYLTREFLGEPSPVADVGAPGGARPWLSTVLLRTAAGLLELDPRAPQRGLRRSTMTGVADALAVDAKRGVRLDPLGRASFTTDAGATWTDVLATRGVRVRSLSEGPAGEVVLDAERDRSLVLGPSGDLAPLPETVPSNPRVAPSPLDALRPASSRALPAETLAHAVAGGALLPGGRILVAREGGVRVLALQTGLPLADADLAGVDARFSRCQAAAAGSGAPLPRGPGEVGGRAPPDHDGSPPGVLACIGDTGAAVIDLEGSLSRPALEATFPAGGGGFAGGHRGRLLFDGRCGPEPPASTDLGPGTQRPAESNDEQAASAAPPPAPEPAGPPELPADDDARVCVRASTSHWVERRLRGEDARRLYRWIPGDDGTVTALVLGESAGGGADAGAGDAGAGDAGVPGGTRPRDELGPGPAASAGVRVIRVDPDDAALAGGAFPAVPPPQKEAPHRSVDVDFWQDDDGTIRGWILLPADGEEKVAAPPSAQGPAQRLLPVAARRGGRVAGVRIDAAGKLTLLPLPKGTVQVVTGGRFALAMTDGSGDDVAREGPTGADGGAAPPPADAALVGPAVAGGRAWFETVDGGATWTPVEGPPVGTLEAPSDENATFACSPIGCAWSSGVVRLGWGGPRPAPRAEPALTAAAGPRVREAEPTSVVCRMDGPPPWGPAEHRRGTAAPRAPGSKGPSVREKPPKPPAPGPTAAKPPAPAPPDGRPPPAKPSASKPAATSSSGAKSPGAKSPGAKSPGAKAPGAKAPGAKVSSAKALLHEAIVAATPSGLPIALRLPTTAMGTLREHSWSAEVLPPFQPAAGPRHLSATERGLHGTQGSVVPLLGAGPHGAVDLLLLVEKLRLRAGGGAASFFPFGAPGRFTIAADAPGGAVAVLDADRGAAWLAQGEATAGVLHLVRVVDAARTRLTLAQRLAGGLSVAAYSASAGEIVAGDLDLGRAEVAPLAALARLDGLAEAGACSKATHRMLVELPVKLRLAGRGGEVFFEEPTTVSAVIDAGPDRVCVEAVEAVVRRGEPVVVRATLGPGGSASLWSPRGVVRGVCSIERKR